jgi:hypothetical protein
MQKMAKVSCPLHSISASGSIGRVLSFRACQNGSVATRKALPYAQISTIEKLNQQRMKDAQAAFKLLSPADLQRWQTLVAGTGKSAWVYFFKMYQTQNIDPPNTPLIPEITIR